MIEPFPLAEKKEKPQKKYQIPIRHVFCVSVRHVCRAKSHPNNDYSRLINFNDNHPAERKKIPKMFLKVHVLKERKIKQEKKKKITVTHLKKRQMFPITKIYLMQQN